MAILSTCIEWPGARDPSGYGVVWYEGARVYAHRLAFFKRHGRWPHPVCRHTCDNRACWNQTHLVEGSAADNTNDMMERGRGCVGEKQPFAKLTTHDVKTIRARYAIGECSQRALAREYGVNQATISMVINRQRWRDV